MPLYYNSKKIKNLYYNGSKIKEAYLNGVKVYRASQYNPGQVLFESNTPGTYSLSLLEEGIYEITVVAGGASGVGRGDQSLSWQSSSGASGACYKGRVKLFKKSYSIVIGAGGVVSYWSGTIKYADFSRTGHGYTGRAGDVSSISEIVSCPSQKASGHNGMYLFYNNNGAPSLYVTPISTSINKAGNNGTGGYNPATRTGAISAYNNSLNGPGAGGNCTAVDVFNMTATNGQNGYVKIVYIDS